MFRQQNKKAIIIPICFAIVSIIAVCIAAIISNGTVIEKEAIGKVITEERKAPETEQTGSVTVKYVDVDGNQLADSTTLTGTVGSEYRAVRKDIATYAPYGLEPFNKAGNYTADSQEVTFVYEKEDSSVEVSEENNTVTISTLHARNAKEYDVKIVTKDENGNLIKGMIYNVTDSNGNTLRNGKVEGNNFVVGTLTIADEGVDTYTVEEDTQSYYEKLEERNIEFTITKTWNAENNSYEMALTYPSDYNGVTISVDDETSEIIINITNKEIDGGNVFDLEVEKYVQKVVVKENGKITKEFTVNENNKNEIVKIDVAKSKLDKMKLEITYKIIVENVGNIPGYATEIKDYLPEEFNYLSGGEWTIDGKTATTTELKDILLNSGDKKELLITVEWDLNEKSVGLKENKVEITDYQNDLELEDKTPDNVDTEDIITTVKTGGAEIPAGIILIVLNAMVLAVYMLKRNRKESSKHEK